MNQVESSVSEFLTPRSARDVKRKSKKRRKAQHDDVAPLLSENSSLARCFYHHDFCLVRIPGACLTKLPSRALSNGILGDDVCAICDDGGYVTCCDGGCLRSFHLTEEHGEGSKCPSLEINSEEAKMIIDKKDFICKNCKYKKHQCSSCGLLGSSDLSSGAEVFQCKDYNCGHFYHPNCVSKLLYPDDKLRACHFEQYVAAGLKFLCHVHKCSVCHGAEKRDDKNMQFAVCRLCPITYHRKCLPSDIPFEAKEGPNGYIFQRAWDGILRDRILIYCMKHEIVKELEIPRRKLIIFPDDKNLCVPKGPESAPKEQDTLAEEELLDHPSSEPSQSLPSAAAQNQCFCSNPMDSFAPKSLFPHPYPGSCGWLGD